MKLFLKITNVTKHFIYFKCPNKNRFFILKYNTIKFDKATPKYTLRLKCHY